MKVLTIIGTRPEIIRLCLIISKLDRVCTQILVHTGQNYDPNLSENFMTELGVRAPDYYMGARGSFAEQAAVIFTELERIILKERPDKMLVLGDTNSSLAAVVAKRMGVTVYHMEAGNRCFDERVPEEVNRRLIDHCSDVLLPYTQNSKQYLLAEGIPGNRIFVTGNPIYEVMQSKLKDLRAAFTRPFVLVTLHRAETVDNKDKLQAVLQALQHIGKEHNLKVVLPAHPRTRNRIVEFGLDISDIDLVEPMGFREFASHQVAAELVITDSGTVQEEAAILQARSVIIRDTTERPETQESGSTVVAGRDTHGIVDAVRAVLILGSAAVPPPPAGYADCPTVSETIVRLLLSNPPGKLQGAFV